MEFKSRETIHRRKSSKDEDDILVDDGTHGNGFTTLSAPPSRRSRVQSTPLQPSQLNQQGLLSPGAQSAFVFPRNGLNGSNMNGHITSPLRTSFSHVRTPSASSAFSASASSPLSSSFPSQSFGFPNSNTGELSNSNSTPDTNVSLSGDSVTSAKHGRRHSRVHSRNLSVFFPRPGAAPQPTISEDGSQEISFPQELSQGDQSPTDKHVRTPLGAGFKFGARPPSDGSSAINPPSSKSGGTTTSRRGHHHKHSMSHNFFSFLEPGAQGTLRPEPIPTTQPAESPFSSSFSSFPPSADPISTSFTKTNGAPVLHSLKTATTPPGAKLTAVMEFIFGAWIWVVGQQCGSLGFTGVGYWVVFDAFGVALECVLPGYLAKRDMQNKHRRSYGNARVETVAMFAQAVYLMFSAVYVCKETVEHLLLSAGGGEGHHHHHGDEQADTGIDFPILLISLSFLTFLGTALRFGNHSKLVNLTGNRIPSFQTLIRIFTSPSFLSRSSQSITSTPPTSLFTSTLTNPYVSSPLLFSLIMFIIGTALPPKQQRFADLMTASFIAIVTFQVAYRACVVLGAVLLQTSPRRGLPGGKMEAFLRAMREVERHPQVLHLPAPHIWQLTPSTAPSLKSSLVVTMELHVRDDLGDDDVLALTKWAWDRCVRALKAGEQWSTNRDKIQGWAGEEEEIAEVTVGVVRG